MSRFIATITAVLALALCGCSVPEIPDVTYFRLPPASAFPHADKPLSLLPIEVDTFSAEGVYAEQSLLYGRGRWKLRSAQCSLSDPPSHALQTRSSRCVRHFGLTDPAGGRLCAFTARFGATSARQRGVTVVAWMCVEQDSGEPLIEQGTRRSPRPTRFDATRARQRVDQAHCKALLRDLSR
jgi:hypothetical protein